MTRFTRRSVLGTLAVAGMLSSTRTAAAASNTEEEFDNIQETPETGLPADTGVSTVLGVEVIEHETGDRHLFDNLIEFREANLAGGTYTVISVTESNGRVKERSRDIAAPDGFHTAQNSRGIDPRVTVVTNPQNDVISPNENPTVKIGAVERENDIAVGVAADVDLEVALIGPESFDPIETRTITTGNNGVVSLEFDHFAGDDAVSTGDYRVEARLSGEDTTADDFFRVGNYTRIPFHWTGMTPGEETPIGIYAGQGLTPASGVTREVTVQNPEGEEQSFDVDIGDGGIGILEYTPDMAGDYRFEAGNSRSETIGAGELKAFVPYFEVRDQYIGPTGETTRWGGQIVDGGSPAANEDVVVTLTASNENEPRAEYEATTNDFGQFTVDIQKPEEPVDFDIHLETTGGRSIFLFGDSMSFDEVPSDESDEPAVNLSVDVDDFRLAPAESTTLTVSLSDGSDPVSDQAITLLITETFQNVPVGQLEVETDETGVASVEYTLPDTVSDGERLYVDAVTNYDGEFISSSSSSSIERFDVDIPTFEIERGENDLDATVVERSSGDPVEGTDLTIFGQRYNVQTETFDTDHDQTGGDGTATLSLTVPEDARRRVMINELTPYVRASASTSTSIRAFDVTTTVRDEAVKPGGTLTLNYTADTTAAVSAIATFPNRDGAQSTIVTPGEDIEIEVPNYLDPGSSERLNLLVISESGDVVELSEFVSIAAELTAGISVSSTDVEVNEAVVFEDQSIPTDGASIESREWDLTGDGTTDETGETVTSSYDEPGVYTVELTVTDTDGNTDTATEDVQVTESEDPDESLADYANDDGTVDASGLQDAFSDWQAGNLDGGTLQDAFAAWQSGNPVT